MTHPKKLFSFRKVHTPPWQSREWGQKKMPEGLGTRARARPEGGMLEAG